MKARYSLSLLSAFFLAAGIATAQQPAAPPSADAPFERNFSFLIEGGGFLGVYAEDISRENMGRYHLSQARGVGVTQVIKDSPAEKAGLRKDDVIFRIDGENVTSVRKLNRLVSEIAPDQSVKVNFSRGGSEQEVTATIAKRNTNNMVGDLLPGDSKLFKWDGNPNTWKWAAPNFGKDFPNSDSGDLTLFMENRRRIGVSTINLTKQLADYFGIADGKGVLVTAVTDDGPAAKAGVKAGDVITAIDGEAVDSPGDISRVINKKKEGEVTLTVVRNKAQQTIRVMPKEAGGFSGTFGQQQIGRRIVIPRIVIPTMPEIDIAMPNIMIPSIPSINIAMPRIRVMPRVRIRGVQGPI